MDPVASEGGRIPRRREGPDWHLALVRALDEQRRIGIQRLQAALDQNLRIPPLRLGEGAQALLAAIPRALVETAREIGKRLAESFPPNWRDLDEDEFDRLVALAQEGALCLVWVPNVDLVRQILAAPDHAARECVLVEARETILDDVERAVQESRGLSSAPLPQEITAFVLEAVAAARARLDRAAQALLAAALSRLLHDGFGFEFLGQAFKAWHAQDLEETLITELRITCIQLATANAMRNTSDAPPGFNRHGTQHGNSAFITEPALLAGLLLLAGWLRELAWIDERAARDAALLAQFGDSRGR